MGHIGRRVREPIDGCVGGHLPQVCAVGSDAPNVGRAAVVVVEGGEVTRVDPSEHSGVKVKAERTTPAIHHQKRPARGPVRCFDEVRCRVRSKLGDGADGFALFHEVETVVDLIQRQFVGDWRVNFDFVVHVPVDNNRHICAPFAPHQRRCHANCKQ